MTTPVYNEDSLATISERLDGLTDLFRRRLLDDRSKQAAIEDLQARLTRSENTASARSLKPIVDGLSLVIERLQGADSTADLRATVIEELEYVLQSLGITPIVACASDPIDRLRHEILSASGDGTDLRVAELVRGGYEKDGTVLRPAKVIAIRVPPGASIDSSESGSEE